MKYTLVISTTALLLSACASNEKAPVEVQPAPEPVVEAPAQVEAIMSAPENGVFFPQLQGTWVRECQPFDPDEPDGSYEITTMDFQGNDYQSNTTVYQDSSCTTELTRGFLQAGSSFQAYGTLTRPTGGANTQLGAAAFININNERYTIDNQPIVASMVSFFQPETTYTIVLVSENQFFLGDDYASQDAESTAGRPRTLNMEQAYTKR